MSSTTSSASERGRGTRNIVFDLGGVVFAWKPAEVIAAQLPDIAPNPQAAQQLAKAIFAHPQWQAFDQGLLGLDDVTTLTAQRVGIEPERLLGLLGPVAKRLVPIDSTVALIASLVDVRSRERHAQARQSVAIYYLSNMPVPYSRELEQRHAFMGAFDGGVFSGDVRQIKPQPHIYATLAQRYGLEAHNTLFIDDLAENLLVARDLGWAVHHCTEPSALPSVVAAFLR